MSDERFDDEDARQAVLGGSGLPEAALERLFTPALTLATTLTGMPAGFVAFAVPEGLRVVASQGAEIGYWSAAQYTDAVRAPTPGRFDCDAGDGAGPRHHLSIPLVLDDIVIGALCVAGRDAPDPPANVVEGLAQLGRLLSAQLAAEREAQGMVRRAERADIENQMRLQRESEYLAERLTATFASIQDPFFTIDGHGRVSAINDPARRIFGHDRDVVGEPVWRAMEGLGRSRVALECRIAAQQNCTVRFESYLEAYGGWYDVSIFPASIGVTVLLRDVDARMRDELVHSAEARVLAMIAAEKPLADILEHIVLGVEAAIPAMTGAIQLYDQDAGCLNHGAAPGLPLDYSRAIDGMPVGPTAGSCGAAAWSGEPVFVADIEADARWEGYRELARPHGLRACWSIPAIAGDGKVIATFAMYYREPRLPTDEDMVLIGRTVNLIAIAITRSREQSALRASEERFRGVFRDCATGMVVTTTDGRFLEANRAYCDMLGYTVEELRAIDFLAITHEDDRRRNQELFAQLLHGLSESFVIEKRYWTKDRRIVWVRVSTTLQREDGRPMRLVAVAEDVTVRHEAEEALRRQSALLAMASRIGKLGAWQVEVPSGKLTWSDELRNLLGAPADYRPVLDLDGYVLCMPHSRDVVADAVRACMQHGTPIDLQTDVVTMKGDLLRAHILGEAVRDASGAICRVQGAFQNITEHHRLMQRVAESEARLREIAENVRDVFWVRTADDGISYVSPAYERIWGRSCEELYANPRSWLEAVHPDDLPAVLASRADPAREFRAEYRIIDAEGSERWIADNGFPVLDQDGRVLRVTGVAHEITGLKRAELGLRDALEQLARSNRELEDFAYVASHDLQEPLRKIKVFSDRLTERGQNLGTQERDYLARMSSAADRMQHLISGLLGFSRVATRAQPMRPVPLDALLDEVLVDLEVSVAEADARIEREPLPEVVGDPLQLQQLLQNIVGNALKFRKPGVAPVVRIYARCNEGQLCVCVADNGIGIAEEHIERIFRPFQRLHGQTEYPGSGIGLAIVKKIADRHGAGISVKSRPDEGAEFRVCFARHAQEA